MYSMFALSSLLPYGWPAPRQGYAKPVLSWAALMQMGQAPEGNIGGLEITVTSSYYRDEAFGDGGSLHSDGCFRFTPKA